ncbi:hypothetical protein CPL00134L_CDS0058 [Escherichia phage Phagiculus]
MMKIVITNPTMALSRWIESKGGTRVFEAEKSFDGTSYYLTESKGDAKVFEAEKSLDGTSYYLTDYNDMIIFSFECEELH